MKKRLFLFFLPATIGCLLGSFSTPYSYQDHGKTIDITTTPCGGGETNSMWIKMTIATGGTFVFSIIPKDPVDDYDFAVFKGTCANLSQSNVVRCNFNNNFPGSNVPGETYLIMVAAIFIVHLRSLFPVPLAWVVMGVPYWIFAIIPCWCPHLCPFRFRRWPRVMVVWE